MLSKVLLAVVVIIVIFLAGLQIYESYRSSQTNDGQEADYTTQEIPQF